MCHRQDKTDNLDETLQNVAKQLDQMEQACHDVGKKLGGCLRTKSLEGDKKFVSMTMLIPNYSLDAITYLVHMCMVTFYVLLIAKTARMVTGANNGVFVQTNSVTVGVSRMLLCVSGSKL